ncbi:MAG TPA: hypothetical protein VFX53_04590 [Pedococcus sp.]|nr:hypothetical protein [Pedococcus sp.]
MNAAREAERTRRRAEAVRVAETRWLSIACQMAETHFHRSCLGEEAAMNNGAGCLCTCHDKTTITEGATTA